MIQSLAKTVAVVACTTILSTLAVNAMDIHGIEIRTMLGAVFSGVVDTGAVCPDGMVYVDIGLEPFCVDAYEASAGDACAYPDPSTAAETALNLAHGGCTAVSRVGQVPWRFVTRGDAARACERSGKRLLTAREWYLATLGTPDLSSGYTRDDCQVADNRKDGVSPTGSGIRCVSDVGVYDMIGNVAEWIEGDIVRGVWNGYSIHASGVVSGIGLDGIPLQVNGADAALFHDDRLWIDPTITAGVMRGGHYGSGSAAGVYATYAASPPEYAGGATGFRCAKDIEWRV